jgi:outer membrane protein
MNKIIGVLGIIGFIISITCLTMQFNKQKKTVFVNIETVYDEFTMKKELESKFETVTQIRQQMLDSIKLELTIMSKSLSANSDPNKIEEFKFKRQEYAIKEQSFTESTEQTNEQYKNQIWKQLSQYIKQFGKKNKYTYMLGFENKSSILYGDEAEDVSKELIIYVNEMYKGGVK